MPGLISSGFFMPKPPRNRPITYRNFLSTEDWSQPELQGLLDQARALKGQRDDGLAGKKAALIFYNPSLRTRTSFQVAMLEQGGDAIVLDAAGTWPLEIEDGALYTSLHRMHKRGWLEAEWGVSENNRRAKYYRLTPAGQAELGRASGDWERYADAVFKVLGTEGGAQS